mmetsp:Transcript_33355/g.64999  ORF Transcript_33355/g.64999 Transcript_33355/m.64999 type:complete len:171 (-) Transcript_33355:205-717(-)
MKGNKKVWKIKNAEIQNNLQTAIRKLYEGGSLQSGKIFLGTSDSAKNSAVRSDEKRIVHDGRKRPSHGNSSKSKRPKKPVAPQFSREDTSLGFHIINQAGNGRISKIDLVESAKQVNMVLTIETAESMIKYACSKGGQNSASKEFVNMETFMLIAQELNVCPTDKENRKT